MRFNLFKSISKSLDRVATESYPDRCKRKGAKNIARLGEAFRSDDEKKKERYLLRLMKMVAAPHNFKNSQQFFDTFQFTDQELCDITGCAEPDKATKTISNHVEALLKHGTYKRKRWASDMIKLAIVHGDV